VNITNSSWRLPIWRQAHPGFYQTGVRLDIKADETPVTVADRLAEELNPASDRGAATVACHRGRGIRVKEAEGATFRWFIDSIDGTKSFVRGVPLYAV